MHGEKQPDQGSATRKSRPINATQATSSPTLEQRQQAALENYENLRAFYQGETIRYSRWYVFLQVLTLGGAAMTPILLLSKLFPPIVQALPSAVGGLAAALNASLHYRQYWADNYYALSALMNEHDKFTVRASPDYNMGDAEAVDAFQNRISLIAMSEVASWRDFVKTTKEQKS